MMQNKVEIGKIQSKYFSLNKIALFRQKTSNHMLKKQKIVMASYGLSLLPLSKTNTY